MVMPKKFTPLSGDSLKRALDNSPELQELSVVLKPYLEKYRDDIVKLKKGVPQNYDQVMKFLYKLALVGADDQFEKDVAHDNYEVNSNALRVINAYYKGKNSENLGANVEVVSYGDRGHPHYYQGFINSLLKDAIVRDFSSLDLVDEFNKVYVAEAGSGSHFYNVVIKKEVGSNEPVVELFDSSPKLARGGLETAVNLVKWGTAEQLIVPATVSQALAGTKFVFKNDNYFHNLEPFQKSGPKYCGTYSLEQAYEAAKIPPSRYIEFLRDIYQYDSIYGGKAELDIGYQKALEEFQQRTAGAKSSLGKAEAKAYRGVAAAMSHFNSFTDSEERQQYLAETVHKRKSGAEETLHHRRERYLADGFNEMVEEKSMRQRLHLFEIITSPDFMTLGASYDGELSLEAKKYQDFLQARVRLVSEQVGLKSGGEIEEGDRFLDAFKKQFKLPFSFNYKAEEDRAKAVIRYVDFERQYFDDAYSIIASDPFLSERFVFKEEPQRIDGNFDDLHAHQALRSRDEITIEIRDCKEFFARLERAIASQKVAKETVARVIAVRPGPTSSKIESADVLVERSSQRDGK